MINNSTIQQISINNISLFNKLFTLSIKIYNSKIKYYNSKSRLRYNL